MPPALALVALAFAAGIALRETLLVPLSVCAAAALFASIALVLAWRTRMLVGMAALAAAFALGALGAAEAWPRLPVGLVEGEAGEVRARVVASPERNADDARVLLDLDEVIRDGESRTATGSVRVAIPGVPVEPLLPGDRVRFRARLARPRGFA